MIPDLSALVPVTRWECHSCTARDTTRESAPHSRFHACAAKGGLTMPMVREGERVKVTANLHEDYVGREDVQYDGAGRPVMSVTTEYADGHTDLAVLAPTAHIDGRA